MKTEEEKNDFIERHNNAIEKITIVMNGVEVALGEFQHFQKNIFKGGMYLKEMGYSNIYSIRSLVDAYSWESEIRSHGFTNENLKNLDETLITIRAFVVHVFQQRFTLGISIQDESVIAFSFISGFKISSTTTVDYRRIYCEMLGKQESKWAWHLKEFNFKANSDISYIEENELILFESMNVDSLSGAAVTIGAIDDFIITTDFNDSNIIEFTKILSYALGGIIVKGDGGVFNFSERGDVTIINQDGIFLNVSAVIEDQIKEKQSNIIFDNYFRGLTFIEQDSVKLLFSMKECSINLVLALQNLIKNKN